MKNNSNERVNELFNRLYGSMVLSIVLSGIDILQLVLNPNNYGGHSVLMMTTLMIAEVGGDSFSTLK